MALTPLYNTGDCTTVCVQSWATLEYAVPRLSLVLRPVSRTKQWLTNCSGRKCALLANTSAPTICIHTRSLNLTSFLPKNPTSSLPANCTLIFTVYEDQSILYHSTTSLQFLMRLQFKQQRQQQQQQQQKAKNEGKKE